MNELNEGRMDRRVFWENIGVDHTPHPLSPKAELRQAIDSAHRIDSQIAMAVEEELIAVIDVSSAEAITDGPSAFPNTIDEIRELKKRFRVF
jgi:hypothetical protein